MVGTIQEDLGKPFRTTGLLTKELGCHDFLSKPFSKNDFDKTIESVHRELCCDYSAS